MHRRDVLKAGLSGAALLAIQTRAFAAADELGFYLSVEIAAWTAVGDGQPIDQWLYDEAARVLKSYGNHPSFMLMPYGNEPGGNFIPFLKQWVEHYKAKDSRRLYTSGSGWPQIPENQFHVSPDPRVQAWGGGQHLIDETASFPQMLGTVQYQ